MPRGDEVQALELAAEDGELAKAIRISSGWVDVDGLQLLAGPGTEADRDL